MPAEHPSRRAFMLGVAATAITVAGRAPSAARSEAARSEAARPEEPRPSSDTTRPADAHLTDLGATEAVSLMSRGDLPVERYTQALLARCADQRALNAFITFEPERVLEAARARDLERRGGTTPGPLFGLPIPIKDSVNTRDYPTTAGTPALRHFRPRQDAPTVTALRNGGAILLGKTNLHELSYGWTSNNLAFGPVRNPYDHDRVPGGSSGGTAAAVAARLAPLGVAEDTEGSIRVPAAFCGIAGFRPTTGRYSTRGCVPISPLFDQIGPEARNVADLALFDSVVANDWASLASRSLRGVRLGLVRDYWFTDLDPEVERVSDLALGRLRDAGAVLIEGRMPDLARLVDLTTLPIQSYDVRVEMARYLAEYDAGVTLEELVSQASPDIREAFRSGVMPGGADVVSESAYRAARDRHLPAIRRLYRDYFLHARVDALVFPPTMVPPPLIGAESAIDVRGHTIPFDTALSRNIAPGSTAGIPGLVLPAGLTRTGLPVALEFDAPQGSDRALLALGLAFERALGPLPPPPGLTVRAATSGETGTGTTANASARARARADG